MRINWTVRVKNKRFWLSIIPAVILLIQAVGSVFGLTLDFGETGDKLVDVVNAVFVVLSLLGVVNDPTTYGYGDSNLAMTYETPRKDKEEMPIHDNSNG